MNQKLPPAFWTGNLKAKLFLWSPFHINHTKIKFFRTERFIIKREGWEGKLRSPNLREGILQLEENHSRLQNEILRKKARLITPLFTAPFPHDRSEMIRQLIASD